MSFGHNCLFSSVLTFPSRMIDVSFCAQFNTIALLWRMNQIFVSTKILNKIPSSVCLALISFCITGIKQRWFRNLPTLTRIYTHHRTIHVHSIAFQRIVNGCHHPPTFITHVTQCIRASTSLLLHQDFIVMSLEPFTLITAISLLQQNYECSSYETIHIVTMLFDPSLIFSWYERPSSFD